MHTPGSQLTSIPTCSRHQRKRKLSRPQKRLQHIDSKEDQLDTETWSLRHKFHQNPHAGFTDAASSETTDGSRGRPDPCNVKSETVVCDAEDMVDSIKKEPTHEFIVDEWYDLGPSPHKYAYSPGSPESMTTEKMEVKDTNTDCCTDSSSCPDTGDSSKPKMANMSSNKVPPGRTFDPVKGMRIPVTTQLYPCPQRQNMSGSTEVAHGKESYKMTSVAGPDFIRPMSVFQPFMRCPLSTTRNPFVIPHNHFPLSVPTASPYLHLAPAASPTTETAAFNTSAAQRHNYSCWANLGIAKPDIIPSHFRPQAAVPHLSHRLQNYSACSKTDQTLTTISGMPGPSSLPSVIPNPTPFQGPAGADHFLATGYTRCEGAIDCQDFHNPENLYQSNSFHSSSVLLVPSRPYYVQQMPKVNCHRLHVDALRCSSNVDTGAVGSDYTPQEAERNSKTSTSNSEISVLGTSNPMTSSASLTRNSERLTTEEKQADSAGPASQHPARIKVKPKRAACTDFIDPTAIKFGADDVETDDDLSKLNELNELSDCSDTEWQPRHRDFKANHRRDSDGGNGWTSKCDGFTQLDSSVKKTCGRRRQRTSKDLAECDQCGKVFKGNYYLRRHQLSHSDIRPFKCSLCHKSFKQKAHLIGHQSVHERALKLHASDGQPPSPKLKSLVLGSKCPGRPRKAYTEKERACRECGKLFKTVYRLKRHELSHTDVRPFSCRICGKAFKQTGHRNEHEANHETTKKRFLCNMCGVVFRCRSSFNNHMRSHGMEKLRLQMGRSDLVGAGADSKQETSDVCHTGYDCPYCTEKFATAQALNSHLETHVEVHQRRHVQPYSCDVCRRTFTYRHNLIKHKLIHKAPDKFAQFYQEKFQAHLASGKPSFSCTKCAKVFIRKETLAKHCKIHTGSKPFKCTICSHEFTQNVHLKVHMRKHTGSRPFQCKECHRSFIDSTALAKHIEYEACNTDNSLYHCRLCDKMHYYLGSLKKHIRKRHGTTEADVDKYIVKSERSSKRRGPCEGEAFPCRVCSSSFSEKCNLVRHIRRKHAILLELLQKELEGKQAINGDSNSDQKLTVAVQHPWLLCCTPESGVAASREEDVGSRNGASSDELPEETNSCEQLNTPEVAASSLLNAEEEIVSVDTETCDVSLRAPATPELVKSSERLNSTLEGAQENSLSAEKDKTRSPLKHTRRKTPDGPLERFQSSKFELGDHQPGPMCTHEPLPCKRHGFSHVQANSSSLQQLPHVPPTDLIASDYKCNSEEESSSPTDIHFLYKIGLVVSSKGKVPRTSAITQTCENRNKEWNCDTLASVCKSATTSSSSVSADDSLPRGQLDQGEYQHQTPHLTCCRSRSFTSFDDGYTDRGDAITTTDDSCSLGFSNESKQGLNPSPSGSSCEEVIHSREIYASKHSLQVTETSGRSTEHLGSEMEPHSGKLENHSTGIGNHSNETDHHSNEVERHSSETEHRYGVVENQSSEIEHHSTFVVSSSSETGLKHGEAENRDGEKEGSSEIVNLITAVEHLPGLIEHHPTHIEHHPTHIEHHSDRVEHHSGRVEQAPTGADMLSVSCEHKCQTTSSSNTHQSDRCMVPALPQCNTQAGTDTGSNTLGARHTSTLQPLHTGQASSVVVNRSNLTRWRGEGARVAMNKCLGTVCRTAGDVGILSKRAAKITCLVKPSRLHHRGQEDGQRDKIYDQQQGDLKQCATLGEGVSAPSRVATLGEGVSAPSRVATLGEGVSAPSRVATLGEGVRAPSRVVTLSEGVSAPSRVSVLLQADPEKGKMYMISLGPEMNSIHSPLRTSTTGVCVVTVAKAVTSAVGKCSPGTITTGGPSLDMADTSVETADTDREDHGKIHTESNIVCQQGKPVRAYSLIHKIDTHKPLTSSGCLSSGAVSNQLTAHVSSKYSQHFSSHELESENFRSDYEPCPTEAHIQYLGLLACKDAQAVKNRSTPVADLYQAYKPWLEEMVRHTRPRRSRVGDKLDTTTRGKKNPSSTITATTTTTSTVAEQLTYPRKTASSGSLENRVTLGPSGPADSLRKAVDSQKTPVGDSDMTTQTWPCVETSLGELQTDPGDSLQTAQSRSHDSEVPLNSGHTSRSISPTIEQLATASPPPPSASSPSSAAAPSASENTLKEDQRCTHSGTIDLPAGQREFISGCAESSSPLSTADSTGKGKQVYVCLECNKYFTARHQLKRHAMTHTDHRPFACDKCGRAFRQKVHLSDHAKRHQGQRPFVCAGCGKRFVLKNEMNQHIKNHCRGSLDIFKGVSVVSDQRVIHVSTTEGKPPPGAPETATQSTMPGQDCMLMIGQCYRAGDIISNGTITLKVIESAYQQPQEKGDTTVHCPDHTIDQSADQPADHTVDHTADHTVQEELDNQVKVHSLNE